MDRPRLGALAGRRHFTVDIIAIALVLSAEKTSRALGQIQRFQKVAVVLTESVLIAVGLGLTLTNLQKQQPDSGRRR